jgi:hypothetical protein
MNLRGMVQAHLHAGLPGLLMWSVVRMTWEGHICRCDVVCKGPAFFPVAIRYSVCFRAIHIRLPSERLLRMGEDDPVRAECGNK